MGTHDSASVLSSAISGAPLFQVRQPDGVSHKTSKESSRDSKLSKVADAVIGPHGINTETEYIEAESCETESKSTLWDRDRLKTEVIDILTAFARSDADALRGLAQGYRKKLATWRAVVKPSLEPLKNPEIAYGALLGLTMVAETAPRMTMSPKILGALFTSSESRKLLGAIAIQGEGSVDKARLPELTGVNRHNVHSKLEELESLGLIARHPTGKKGSRVRIEMESPGWAAVELMKSWGLEPCSVSAEEIPEVGV